MLAPIGNAEAGPLRELFEWAGKQYTEKQAMKRATQEAAERRATREAAERVATRESRERRTQALVEQRRLSQEAATQKSIREAAERQAIRDQAERQLTREATDRAAQRTVRARQFAAVGSYGRKITVGTLTLGSGVLVGQMALAGYQPNPVPFEQDAVLREMVRLLSEKKNSERASTETVYQTKTCDHPETGELYVVPRWYKVCPNGTPPKTGKPIVLSGLSGSE